MPVKRRTLVSLFGVLLLVLTAACTSTSKDGVDRSDAASVANGFAVAMSKKDASAASKLTDKPGQAAKVLAAVFKDLPAKKVSFSVAKAPSGKSSASASFKASWDFGKKHVWSYNVPATLKTDKNGNWNIVWSPADVHPSLTADTTLSYADVAPTGPAFTDSAGQPLMSEQTVDVVRLDPTQVTDPAGTSKALAGVLNQFDPSITADSIAAELAASPTKAVSIVTLRSADADPVMGQLQQIVGVSTVLQNRLLTVDSAMSSPVFTDLKKVWDDEVKAHQGWRVSLLDAKGATASVLAEGGLETLPDIQTTMEPAIQSAAQLAIENLPAQAAIVALRPSTGAVLAVAQNDAANAEGPIALTGQYPPGSTFKIVTSTAIISAGVATADSIEPCPGTATIEGRTIPNENQFDLGQIPFHTAFAQSCNTTMAALASKLPGDALHKTALGCGIGVDYTTPGLTTLTGKVPVTTNAAEQVESAIGQGSVVVSPFGLALCAASVVTGQTPTPDLIVGQPAKADQKPAPMPAAVLPALRSMMTEVVTSGTAKQLKNISGLAGKTGTAQFGDGTHSHGWFVGTYKDLAFAVLLVGADSSTPAVNVAGDFLKPILNAIPG